MKKLLKKINPSLEQVLFLLVLCQFVMAFLSHKSGQSDIPDDLYPSVCVSMYDC